MSLVRLLGFTTLTCGCVVGRYRELATSREVAYVEEKGKGCATCNFTGMKGRVAIYEVMPVGEELRSAILKNASTAELRAIAETAGMRSLRQAGLMKVIEGTTTIEEVLRVTLS